MPESLAYKCKRKLLSIDHLYFSTIARLYEYYYILLRSDAMLATAVEIQMLELENLRQQNADVFRAAWESDHEQFDDIGQVPELIRQARKDVFGGEGLCRAYLNVLDLSAARSCRLLRARAEAFSKPSV